MQENNLDIEKQLAVFTKDDIADYLTLSRPFRSDTFAIIHVRSGKFIFLCNSTVFSLQANNLFFALPGSVYELQHIAENSSILGISFSKKYLEVQGIHTTSEKMARIFSSEMQLQCVLTTQESGDVGADMESLYRKMNYPAETPYLQEIVKYAFLSTIYTSSLVFYKKNKTGVVKLNRNEEIADNFINLLTISIKAERGVQFFADALFVSSRHLSKVVKQVTGKTRSELINAAVIREAKILLSAKSTNVTHVAALLQFSDPSSFGKYFKRYAGLSPSEYRQNCRNIKKVPF